MDVYNLDQYKKPIKKKYTNIKINDIFPLGFD